MLNKKLMIEGTLVMLIGIMLTYVMFNKVELPMPSLSTKTVQVKIW